MFRLKFAWENWHQKSQLVHNASDVQDVWNCQNILLPINAHRLETDAQDALSPHGGTPGQPSEAGRSHALNPLFKYPFCYTVVTEVQTRQNVAHFYKYRGYNHPIEPRNEYECLRLLPYPPEYTRHFTSLTVQEVGFWLIFVFLLVSKGKIWISHIVVTCSCYKMNIYDSR